MVGLGLFLLGKRVCQLSLCPSTPLFSCLGMCRATSQQAGLVEDLWNSFIDFGSCVVKPGSSFQNVLAPILACPTKPILVSAAKQSICSRSYLPLLFFPSPPTIVFCGCALILGCSLRPATFSCVRCTKRLDAGYLVNKREAGFGRNSGTQRRELFSICRKNAISLRKKLCWLH